MKEQQRSGTVRRISVLCQNLKDSTKGPAHFKYLDSLKDVQQRIRTKGFVCIWKNLSAFYVLNITKPNCGWQISLYERPRCTLVDSGERLRN